MEVKIKIGSNIMDYNEENLDTLPKRTKKFLVEEHNRIKTILKEDNMERLKELLKIYKPIVITPIRKHPLSRSLKTGNGICTLTPASDNYMVYTVEDFLNCLDIRDESLKKDFPSLDATTLEHQRFVSEILLDNLKDYYQTVALIETTRDVLCMDYGTDGSGLIIVGKLSLANLQLLLEYKENPSIKTLKGVYKVNKKGNDVFRLSSCGRSTLKREIKGEEEPIRPDKRAVFKRRQLASKYSYVILEGCKKCTKNKKQY